MILFRTLLERDMPSSGSGMMKLYHYSSIDAPELELNPSKFGEHQYTSNDARASKMPRTFFYTSPSNRERVLGAANKLYVAEVPYSEIFDLTNQTAKSELIEATFKTMRAKGEDAVTPNIDIMFQEIIRRGYSGVKYDVGFLIVAMLIPISVTRAEKVEA